MFWILSGLLVLILWTLKLVLQAALPLWIPVVGTIVVAVIALAVAIYRGISASRSAKALERAIAQQGAQQALNARPERRAEIQELQKQVQAGIDALKKSKLGKDKKSGAAALYSLPWYVIIGPPGAGKTTALKHSGLVFPFQDPQGGGGVRGVGGTRNCDWWFTNDAILLDTAGRYTTESDDRDEWISFLSMLKRYRSRRPINGVLVAISVAELIDSNEQQIEATGKKIRARIDEVMTQLQMVVPVYILFTKCDLIAGFVEIFGDLRKSDRAQSWGTTLKLDMPKNNPGQIFEQEFDVLTKQVHARALKRLTVERGREAREKIYQFPLEFAGMRRNLAELVGHIFQVNAFQGTPIFRGFYFTSGTQEGRPLERVLSRMGQAMGIRPPETSAHAPVESKSYFLYNVFMNVVFPDGDIAARSAGEIRRQALMRVAVSATAAALALIVAIPGIVSFSKNRTFLRETEERAKAASAINWDDNRSASEKLDALDPLLDRLQELDKNRDEGVPFGMGWWMYRGEDITRPAVAAYVNAMQRGFVLKAKQRLEERLKRFRGEPYLQERTDLKLYLMLSDVEHLDIEWASGKYTQLWWEIVRPTSTVAESELKKKIVRHVEYYFTLLDRKAVLPVAPDQTIVASARRVLQNVPVRKRYYDLFVNSVIDEKYDEAMLDTRQNRKYPAVSLGDVFRDRGDLLKILTSATYEKEKRWKEVEGPYTDRGHYKVVKNVTEGVGLLEREQWVVPLGPDETPDKIAENLKFLAEDYDQRYIEQWNDWLADLRMKSPATVKDAVETYNVLAVAPIAYVKLFRLLEDHTQWKKSAEALDNEVTRQINDRITRKINQEISGKVGVSNAVKKVDLKQLAGRVSRVPESFRKTVEFGVAPAGATAEAPLLRYITKVEKLRSDLSRQMDNSGNLDPRAANELFDDANKEAASLLGGLDDRAKAVISPLLLNPLKIVQGSLGAGRAIGGGKGPAQPSLYRR